MFYFEFDSVNSILRGRFEGLVTDDELIDFYRLEVFPTTIRRLAESLPAISDPNVPRFVVAPSHHVFGLSRLFELSGGATRPNLNIVRAADEVWRLLNVEEPTFEAIQEKEI